MCHPGKATTRAHGQQMSSGLIVRLRAGPGLLGTVEQRHRTARQGGRYKPFLREIAIWAVWAGDKNAALDGPPRARFIGDYPVSFAFCRISCGTSALSEYEEDPMLTSPSTRFHTLRSAYCNLKTASAVLTPSRRRKTRYSTYARPTPPTAQHGPLHTVSDMGVDVHDPRQRCNSEKHPTLSQLFSARGSEP